MKKLLLFAIPLLLLINGCLTYEGSQGVIIPPKNNDAGKISIQYFNIASTDTLPNKIENDFEELIDIYSGDEFLLDQTDEGIYIKSRQLKLNGNQIDGGYSGIFKNFSEMEGFSEDDKQIMFKIDNDFEVVSTNGKIAEIGEQRYIVWKRGTERMEWKFKTVNLEKENRSGLSSYLKKYMKDNPDQF